MVVFSELILLNNFSWWVMSYQDRMENIQYFGPAFFIRILFRHFVVLWSCIPRIQYNCILWIRAKPDTELKMFVKLCWIVFNQVEFFSWMRIQFFFPLIRIRLSWKKNPALYLLLLFHVVGLRIQFTIFYRKTA